MLPLFILNNIHPVFVDFVFFIFGSNSEWGTRWLDAIFDIRLNLVVLYFWFVYFVCAITETIRYKSNQCLAGRTINNINATKPNSNSKLNWTSWISHYCSNPISAPADFESKFIKPSIFVKLCCNCVHIRPFIKIIRKLPKISKNN